MEFDRKNTRIILGIVAFGVILFVGLWHLNVVISALQVLFGMMSFFVLGLCMAFILNAPLKLIERRLLAPLDKRLGKHWLRFRRPVAVLLTVVLIVGIVFLVIFMVIPEMVRTVTLLTDELPGFVQRVTVWWDSLGLDDPVIREKLQLERIDWASIGNAALNLLRTGGSSFLAGTFSAASSIVSGVVNFVVGIIMAVYVLLSKEKLANQTKRILYAYLPEKRADSLVSVGGMAGRIFGNFVSGQCLEAFILGALCFLGMLIFRFPFAPMVAVLVCVTAFIPIFGAFIGCFVGAFMILVNQGWLQAVWFIVFFIVLQQVEGNLIYPHVVGKSVMLPGLWVLVAVTVGGNVAGILGMLVSVPLCALAYSLLREAVNRRNARKKITPAKFEPLE